MLTWDPLVELQGWFPSMHTHHAWVYLEKNLSCDFWVLGKPGSLQTPSEIHEEQLSEVELLVAPPPIA